MSPPNKSIIRFYKRVLEIAFQLSTPVGARPVRHWVRSPEFRTRFHRKTLTERWSLAASEFAPARRRVRLNSGRSSAKRAFITCWKERVNDCEEGAEKALPD
jgi:hypothetical protein